LVFEVCELMGYVLEEYDGLHKEWLLPWLWIGGMSGWAEEFMLVIGNWG
jgi:hypothetical protein